MAELTPKQRKALPNNAFAVPGKRKLPLSDAAHVRNAAARVDQTKGITAAERSQAKRAIAAAEQRFGITPDTPAKKP